LDRKRGEGGRKKWRVEEREREARAEKGNNGEIDGEIDGEIERETRGGGGGEG